MRLIVERIVHASWHCGAGSWAERVEQCHTRDVQIMMWVRVNLLLSDTKVTKNFFIEEGNVLFLRIFLYLCIIITK